MRAQIEFGLQPDGMLVAERLPVVVVVLQPQLGELCRIKRQVRRDAGAIGARIRIDRVVRTGISGDVLTAQACNPATAKTPKRL
jgi:hypothetical protein